MATNQKPIAPDRGAPAPKPSRKVALDEVMRSLQDLVQNELNVEPAAARPAEVPPAGNAEPVTAAGAPAAPAGHTPQPEAVPAVPPEPPASVPEPLTAAEAKRPAAKRPSKKEAKPTGGIQQELPYLDDTGAADDTPAAIPDAHVEPSRPPEPSPGAIEYTPDPLPSVAAATSATSIETDELPDLPAAPEIAATESIKRSTAEPELAATPTESELESLPAIDVDIANPPVMEDASQAEAPRQSLGESIDFSEISILADDAADSTSPPALTDGTGALSRPPAEEIDLGDIPVLEDAVELHEELPAAVAAAASARPAALPTAQEARRLAIQVAARLNVSLRKAGKPVLSSDVIARLARELQEALANAGANVENSQPEK